MKLNPDCVRDILMSFEEVTIPGNPFVFRIEGLGEKFERLSKYSDEELAYHQPNSVHIPPDILIMDAFSLYHAHTNETLLSAQDLRLLINPKIEKIAVITPGSCVAAASIGYGQRPDMLEFDKAVYQVQVNVNMEIFENPLFAGMTILERNLYSINEQCYRLARHFDWHIEGGEL